MWGCSSDGRALALHARGTGIDTQHLHLRHLVRVVKEMDLKSIGLCPRRFESCRCRRKYYLYIIFINNIFLSLY